MHPLRNDQKQVVGLIKSDLRHLINKMYILNRHGNKRMN